MLRFWTIQRATGIGVTAGLAALLLWPAYVTYQEPVRLPYLAALAVTALCGLSILCITALDLLRRRRGRRIAAIRAFDLVLAIALAGPALLGLDAALG